MSKRVMKCDLCPIEVEVNKFAELVADGWDLTHTFQREEFNRGQVIVCTGHFSLIEETGDADGNAE